MDQEWYRAWRHEEREQEARRARQPRSHRREAAKRILGDLFIVAAIVMFAWSMMPV